MKLTRREFAMRLGAIAALSGSAACRAAGGARAQAGGRAMYGLIGRIDAVPGRRDALVAALLKGSRAMPGCLSYVVGRDASQADAVWVTEVWESRAHHEASLGLPAVREAIAEARPLIAGFGDRIETVPVGGHGLAGIPGDTPR
jgi:quinol monooxygenase YgiN